MLIGGPGRDTISGDLAGGDCGPLWCKYPFGNDTIDARDGEVDSVTCGVGTDTVLADAERRRRAGLRARGPGERRAGHLRRGRIRTACGGQAVSPGARRAWRRPSAAAWPCA